MSSESFTQRMEWSFDLSTGTKSGYPGKEERFGSTRFLPKDD